MKLYRVQLEKNNILKDKKLIYVVEESKEKAIIKADRVSRDCYTPTGNVYYLADSCNFGNTVFAKS